MAKLARNAKELGSDLVSIVLVQAHGRLMRKTDIVV